MLEKEDKLKEASGGKMNSEEEKLKAVEGWKHRFEDRWRLDRKVSGEVIIFVP